jgi:cytochrome c oxidase subunit 1
MNETLGKIHFWPTFVGVFAIFIPMHAMGLVGMNRRYSQFYEVVNGKLEYIYHFNEPAHQLIHFVTWAAIITVAAQSLFIFNFFWSMFKGERASDNPWEATTLEWTTATPPPHDNFGGKTPVVYRGAYEFGVPGAPDDYVMQTTPDETEANVASGVAREIHEQGNGHGDGNGHDGHR